MSASITQSLSTSGLATVVDTISTGTDSHGLTRKAITDRPLVAFSYINIPVPQAASRGIWPLEISSIASGDAICFVLDFYHGSTDTSLANKAITITVNAEVIKGWGDSVSFCETSVTTVVVARAAGNESMMVKGFWYVYTV